ncbi:hypothetical protein M426DRAFT_27845 [Hypoxylon sp. CI-4A]|nr:hypothetical protein M426DRAFT_27845 [Hypoxylon sp. CI-4A]
MFALTRLKIGNNASAVTPIARKPNWLTGVIKESSDDDSVRDVQDQSERDEEPTVDDGQPAYEEVPSTIDIDQEEWQRLVAEGPTIGEIEDALRAADYSAEPQTTKNRNYNSNRFGGTDNDTIEGNETPQTYWAAVLAKHKPREGYNLQKVVNILLKIRPHQQPTKSNPYKKLKKRLLAIKRGIMTDILYNEKFSGRLPGRHEFEAVRIYGDAKDGFGTFPTKIATIVWKTVTRGLSLEYIFIHLIILMGPKILNPSRNLSIILLTYIF